MDLDPRRLRVLRAVAVRGGVMDAADLLHVTPSAVSQQLAQLEREVGVPLLDRSQRRATLTAAGRLLVRRADRIEAELAGARADLAAASGRVAGPVVVAAFPTAVRHLLVPALARLERTHPDVRPSIVDLEGPPALRELRTGGLDLVVDERDGAAPPLTHRGLTVRPLLDDEYQVVVPARWRPRPRTLAELREVPWVASPGERACGAALERLGDEHRFSPRRVHVCTEFPAVLALVAAGHGAAIVPRLALIDAPSSVALTGVPAVGFRRLSLLFRATDESGAPEPVVGVLVEALREVSPSPRMKPGPGPARRRA
jgi:DNA-binding transcriptional LysR family regulator